MNKYLALVGECVPDIIINNLSSVEEVADVVVLPKDELIAPPVSSHPDMILSVFRKNLFCHKTYYQKNKNLIDNICSLSGLVCETVDSERNAEYPFDISFNVLNLNDELMIGKKEFVAPPLKKYVLNTNQGYAACSSVFISGTVISADKSILSSAQNANCDTLEIPGKDIIIEGYDYGFIGGATGIFDNTLCFFGDPQKSESGRTIVDFCNKHNIRTVTLRDSPLTDYGGIKFLALNQ